MKIRMLCDKSGSVDGVVILRYLAGQEYDMAKTTGHVELANTFVSQNWAVIATEPKAIEDDKQEKNRSGSGASELDRGEVKLTTRRNKR
jgi:hypothetical protein